MVVWNQSKKGGSVMKRQLKFEFENDKYVIKENDTIVFSIDGKDLKFVSLDFYNGVYKDKSAAIELINAVEGDTLKKGSYIFQWLVEIISSVQSELNDSELEEVAEIIVFKKKVPLFELSACAGNGFYSSGPIDVENEIDSPFDNADYAVRISGRSMEPTIKDQNIVFVQDVKDLRDGDIGIFVVDGEIMCKRYREENEEKWLEPDNKSLEYKTITFKNSDECRIQGKVLLND